MSRLVKLLAVAAVVAVVVLALKQAGSADVDVEYES